MPFLAYYQDSLGNLRTGLSEREVREAFESGQGLLWVEINETSEEDGRFLARVFKFHELAIEDCVSDEIHSPKIDDFGDYLFINIHGINHTIASEVVETTELSIFLGRHFVVSCHNFPLYSIDSIRKMVESHQPVLNRGADFLTHTLMDALMENVIPTIDRMEEVIEDLEEESIRKPQESTLEVVLKLKRSAQRLHRVMVPQREMLNRLSRGEFPLVRDQVLIFYRDVYDLIVRIEDLNQGLRDRADNALGTSLLAMTNRQGETMKVLAVVTAVFLPMMLLTGIYGMNFRNMPELKWDWGYYALLGVIAAAGLTAAGLFWARYWHPWEKRRASKVGLFRVHPERLVDYIGYWARKTLP